MTVFTIEATFKALFYTYLPGERHAITTFTIEVTFKA